MAPDGGTVTTTTVAVGAGKSAERVAKTKPVNATAPTAKNAAIKANSPTGT
jgi:hypothetical protein